MSGTDNFTSTSLDLISSSAVEDIYKNVCGILTNRDFDVVDLLGMWSDNDDKLLEITK